MILNQNTVPAALSAIASCAAGPLAHADQVTIGASILTQQHPFYLAPADAMKQEAQKDLAKLDLSIANRTLGKRIADVQDFVTYKVNVIVISPVDSKRHG
jgi:ribose transport system substrate-binding protein